MSQGWEQDRWIEDGWRTPDTYAAHFEPVPGSPGVYLLVACDRKSFRSLGIVYVGQAGNLAQRLGQHPTIRTIKKSGFWPQRWFKPCARNELRQRERALIGELNPCLNLQCRLREINL